MTGISVIIPAHNRVSLLRRAISSVICQTLPPKEIIVIDDGSREDVSYAVKSFKEFPITYHRLGSNKGAAYARNSGIEIAKNSLIAFLDSDDEWLPRKLEEHFMFHRTVPGLISTTGYSLLSKDMKVIKKRIPKQLQETNDILKGCFLSPGSTMLVNREVFDIVGFFDSSFRRYEDWEWLIRAMKKTSVHVLPKALSIVNESDKPSYAIVNSEVAKIIRSHDGNRKLKSYGHLERAYSAFYQKRYIRTVGHCLVSIKTHPLSIFDMIARSFRFIRGR